MVTRVASGCGSMTTARRGMTTASTAHWLNTAAASTAHGFDRAAAAHWLRTASTAEM